MLQEQHEQTRTTCLLTGPASFNQRTHVHARRETLASATVQRGIPEMSPIKMSPPISCRCIIGINHAPLAHLYKNVRRHRIRQPFASSIFAFTLYRASRSKLNREKREITRHGTRWESFAKSKFRKIARNASSMNTFNYLGRSSLFSSLARAIREDQYFSGVSVVTYLQSRRSGNFLK